ncbi:unnamed protein product [Medioppia subpectinata]|uniref:Uncharacterized protein n=1 Tax=Medioppia subpectinata TaxID=1979941 RepID=A0A7R9KM32_9ACAR|nr:unnamed protein product [Medioppia subpectinata]CAG2105770.1 unnamed protein product [Medioppia subpectinata]
MRIPELSLPVITSYYQSLQTNTCIGSYSLTFLSLSPDIHVWGITSDRFRIFAIPVQSNTGRTELRKVANNTNFVDTDFNVLEFRTQRQQIREIIIFDINVMSAYNPQKLQRRVKCVNRWQSFNGSNRSSSMVPKSVKPNRFNL